MLGQSVLDLVFPPTCLHCRRWAGHRKPPFCSQCSTALESEREKEACPRCGVSVAPFEVDEGQCGRCRNRSSHVLRTVRVAPYGGLVAELLRAFKYRGRDELETILGAWLIEAVVGTAWLNKVEAIVSVPTHWTRRLTRRRYPASVLADLVARHTGVPRLPLLRRVRGGLHQIGLSYTERLTNIRGAFAVRSGVEVRDTKLLLIDDVMTTGATIEECARTLHRSGAGPIFAAVVVRVSTGPGEPLPSL